MEEKPLYVYLSTGEFIPVLVLWRENKGADAEIILTLENGELRDVTGMICMYRNMTHEEADQAITSFRSTGFWPWELPEKEEASDKGENRDHLSWEEALGSQ